MEINWKDLVGKRLLVRKYGWEGNLFEVTVLEVSPSGKYVKLRIPSENAVWHLWRCGRDVELCEELPTPTKASTK